MFAAESGICTLDSCIDELNLRSSVVQVRRAALSSFNADNLELNLPFRRLDAHHLPCSVTNQGIANRTCVADASVGGISFRRTKDCIDLFVVDSTFQDDNSTSQGR